MYTSLNHPSSSSSNSPPIVSRHASVLGAASGLWSDVKQVFRKSQTSIGSRLNRQDENRYDPPRYPGGGTERPPTVSPEVAMDLLQMDASNVFDRLPERTNQGNGGASFTATGTTCRPRPRAARSALEAYRIRSSAPDDDLPDLLDLDSASRSSAEPRLISFDDVSPITNQNHQFSPSYPSTVPMEPQAPLFAAAATVAPTRATTNALYASGIYTLPSAAAAAVDPAGPTSPGFLPPWESGAASSSGPSRGSLNFTPASPHTALNTTSFSSQYKSPRTLVHQSSGTPSEEEQSTRTPPPSCLPTIPAPPSTNIFPHPLNQLTPTSPLPLIGSNTSSPISDQITTTTTNLNLLDL